MALDERAFFNERPEQRNGRYSCPRCKRTNDYQMRWVRRTRKDRVPANADETDRAKFLKLRDHLIRVDDELTCKTCGKRFEIPSMHSLVFVDQLDGLPKVDDDDDELALRASTAPAPSATAPAGNTPSTPAPRQRKGYAPPKAWR
jgi:DNA-directed RNA polymerase subunit RPC12/RpoP